jgi:hypothetical protein
MFRRGAAFVVATIALSASGFAASAAIKDGPPAGATALCNDGTYSYSQTRSGTCSHHGGVAVWLTPSATTTGVTATTSAPAPTTTSASTSTAVTTTATTITTTATSTSTASKTCSAGYVLAHLSWGDKCLRAGEFCKVGNVEYLKYGFSCPSTGHLRRRK